MLEFKRRKKYRVSFFFFLLVKVDDFFFYHGFNIFEEFHSLCVSRGFPLCGITVLFNVVEAGFTLWLSPSLKSSPSYAFLSQRIQRGRSQEVGP